MVEPLVPFSYSPWQHDTALSFRYASKKFNSLNLLEKGLLRIRNLLLGIAIFVLTTGLFLFANATITPRETRSSTSSSSSNWPVSGQEFGYSGETLTPDNPPQFIVGTTGIADLIILRTPWRDFNSWVCHQLPVPQLIAGATWDCDHFGGGYFNVTILDSYLQTHASQIAYSQTIVNQNVTLDYRVTTSTDVTIVLAHLVPRMTRDYWQVTKSNQTLAYPLIGYTERPGTTWNLTSISLGLVAAGTTTLLVALIQFKADSPRKTELYRGPAMQKCPGCGHENLFFAEKCLHCGSILRNAGFRVEVPSHAN